MVNLNIKGYVDKYNDYAKAGTAVFDMAVSLIDKGEMLVFDMKGIDGVSSVFLNTSLGRLMDIYGIERVKKSFRFANLLRSQADRIKKYFADYSEILPDHTQTRMV